MLRITCPECGERELHEFRCGGEAGRAEPADKFALDDADWGDYLFMRANTRGLQFERWQHVHGCRRWFHALRHTVSDRIMAVYRLGESLPRISESSDSDLVAITTLQATPRSTPRAMTAEPDLANGAEEDDWETDPLQGAEQP